MTWVIESKSPDYIEKGKVVIEKLLSRVLIYKMNMEIVSGYVRLDFKDWASFFYRGALYGKSHFGKSQNKPIITCTNKGELISNNSINHLRIALIYEKKFFNFGKY